MRKMIIFCSALLAMAISAEGNECPMYPVGQWITLNLQYQKMEYGTGRNLCEYDSFMSRKFIFTSLGECPKFICYNMASKEVFK